MFSGTSIVKPCLFALALFTTLFLIGCGYAGEPKPPALGRPLKVTGLSAVERGAKVVISFSMPLETTDALPVDAHPDVELRVGTAPNPWNETEWEANSERVSVVVPEIPAPVRPVRAVRRTTPLPKPAAAPTPIAPLQAPAGATGASGSTQRPRTKAATAPSGSKRAKSTARQAKIEARIVAPVITASIDAAKFSGKLLVVGVRVRGFKGRDDGISIVQLEVLPPLPMPVNLKATDAPNAVHLQWTAAAPAFRIFRRQPADTDWVNIGESTQPSFDDAAPEWGKPWQYYVQAVRKVGDGWLESDISEPITFTPTDRFPPAVPAGLAVVSGTKTIELVWDRVADTDLAAYRIYRNGVKIADAVTNAAYSDKEVTLGSKYSYQVSAVDLAGNESRKSEPVEVTLE